MARPPTTDIDAWVDAAYVRFARDGLGGIRIEAVARDLGATKGSFYWHFTDRRALVDAVVARWEASETDAIILLAEQGGTAHERIERLFQAVASRRRGGEAHLYLDAEREGVAAAVVRVTRRRIDYLAELLTEYGLPADEAERRSIISITVVLGFEQLRRVGLSTELEEPALTRSALALVLAPH